MFLKELKNSLSIAVPIAFGQLSQISLNLLDSAMVGNVSHVQLAATSFVNSIIAIPFVVCIGLLTSSGPLIGKLRGQNKNEACGHVFSNELKLSLTLCLAMVFCLIFLSFHLSIFKQDAEVTQYSQWYLIIMSISMLPMIAFLSAKFFTDALEFTKVGLIIAISSIFINFILNYLLIYGNYGFPRLEIVGAAIATLITRIIVACALIFYIFYRQQFRIYIHSFSQLYYWNKSMVRDILKIGIPSALQLLMEISAFSFAGIMIGWIGSKQQAAHQIALGIASATFQVTIGLNIAGSIRTGFAYGQRNIALARTIGYGIIFSAIAWGIICACGFILFKYPLSYVFTHNAEVVNYAVALFFLAGIFQISDSLQGVCAGLLRGMHDIKFPTIVIIVSYWFISLPLAYWLAFRMQLLQKGIWWGLVIGLSVAALGLLIRFYYITKKDK